MPVLIFLDQSESTLKKTTPEVMSYGAQVAAQLGTTAEGVLLGTFNGDVAALGKYGVGKIHHANDASLDHPDGEVYTNIICKVAEDIGAKVIIFSQNLHGRAIAPRVSAKLKAGLVAGAVGLPDTSNGFVVKKKCILRKSVCERCREYRHKNHFAEPELLSGIRERRHCRSGGAECSAGTC